jgi:hypothetical protein
MPILRADFARGFAVACHRSVRREEGRARQRPRVEGIERGPRQRPSMRGFGEYLKLLYLRYEHKRNLRFAFTMRKPKSGQAHARRGCHPG